MLTSCHILLTLGSIQINSNITGNLIEFKYKIMCLNTDLSYLACDPYVGKGNTKKHEKISLVKLMALLFVSKSPSYLQLKQTSDNKYISMEIVNQSP